MLLIMPMSTKSVEKVLRDSSFEIIIDPEAPNLLNIEGGGIALDNNYGMCHIAINEEEIVLFVLFRFVKGVTEDMAYRICHFMNSGSKAEFTQEDFELVYPFVTFSFQDQDTDNRLKLVGMSVIDSGINPNKFIRTLEEFVDNALDRVAAADIEFGKKYNGHCIDNEFIEFENIEI